MKMWEPVTPKVFRDRLLSLLHTVPSVPSCCGMYQTIPVYGYTSFCLPTHQSLGLSLLLGCYEHCCYECSVLVFSPWVSIMGDCRGKKEGKKQTLQGCKRSASAANAATTRQPAASSAPRVATPREGNRSVLVFVWTCFHFSWGCSQGVNWWVIWELCV